MTPRPHTEEPAARVVDDRATVLIVDADRVSERAIERALAPSGYAIEWARDGGSALDIMRATKVDVTVSDSVLSDMSGALLLTRAAELCGPGAPAFVFVSVDRAIPARVALLAAGAVDYLLKPFAADELRARVSNAIAARLAARALSTRGITGLAGDGAQIPIADLLTMLEFARKSGALQIAIGPTVGWLIVDRGRVVHAEVGTLAGQEAFFALLRYGAGLFRFEPGAIDLQPGATRLLEPRPRRASAPIVSPRTIDAQVSELLLESAVREDTDRHAAVSPALLRTEAGLRELGIIKTAIELRSRVRLEPPPPTLLQALPRLAVAIADPLRLGDLVLADDPPEAGAREFVVELWADATEGVQAMLQLASPPGYHVILAALGDGPRRLHLRFELEAATLRVALIDLDAATPPPAVEPHAIVVAPPRGDLISVPPARLAELTARLGGRGGAVLAVGGPALRATLAPLVPTGASTARYRGVPLPAPDLRVLLGDVIALWSAP